MPQSWRNWPLRTQLALSIAAIVALLLIVFGGLLYSAIATFLRDQTASQIRTQSASIIDAVWATPPQRPGGAASQTGPRERERLRTLANALGSRTASAVIYAPDASTLAQAGTANQDGGLAPPMPPPPDRAALARALAGETVELVERAAGQRQLVVLLPITNRSATIAVAQVATSLQAADDLLRQLLLWLVTGTTLAIIAALALGVGVTRAALRPLGRLTTASQRVAGGDYTAQVALDSQNEVGQLGASFDHMVAQVSDSFTAQRRFVADAAHELRTPLTSLGGLTEMLLIGAISEPQRQRQTMQRMNGEIERMTRLVNDLLTLSRIDARPTLRRDLLDLSALAADALAQAEPLLGDHHVRLQAAQPVMVRGDADRLRQVLLNLVDNARKYTPPGGSITLSVAHSGGNGTVSLRDTGIGIPAEALPQVWNRFYRVDQARSRATGGAGLGLAIVRGIVEAQGGQVAITSAPSHGTEVTITLPLERD